MDKYRIDSHKLIYHPARVAQWHENHKEWESAKSLYPIYTEISPVGYCNHRCSFCAVDFMGYEHKKIEFNTLKSTLSQMAEKGVKSVMFAGEGEPTLYKELPQIIEHCTEVGIDTSLTTNMVPFTADTTETYIKHCKWIKVSMNAGTPKVYAQIHNTNASDFDRVIENMQRAVALKKEKGYTCTLGAQMLLLNDNFDTATNLAKITQEIGIDYLVIKPYSQHLSSNTTKYKDIDYSQFLYLEKELKAYNTDKFNVVFRSNTMKKAIESSHGYKKCNATPFFWSYITASGDVYGCSCFLGNKNFCYGNINEASFIDIWEGAGRKAGYDFIQNQLDITNCRENCRMDDINRYLWDLQHPNSHVNFI